MRRVVWYFVVAVALGWSAHATLADIGPPPSYLRPGDALGVPSRCTLNFFFLDADLRPHVGTAAHCVSAEGARVESPVFGAFGTVVRKLDAVDFALIRLDEGIPWDPAVRQVGGPTGVAAHESTEVGDVLETYGHGVGFAWSATTRPRVGVLVGDNAERFWWDTLATPGDSGAPVVHRDTGRGVGIVARVGVEHVATDTGPTLAHALARLDASGYPVSLATASHP